MGPSACCTAPPSVAAIEPLRLEQAMTNLLDNALKCSPNDSLVEIEVQAALDEKLEIIVPDGGSQFVVRLPVAIEDAVGTGVESG